MKLCLLVTVCGCDAAFGLSTFEASPDAAVTSYDRCAPGVLADDPLRFAFVGTDAVGSTGWQAAQAECWQLGMDLQVFHDLHDEGRAFSATAVWPFWFGTSQTTDGTWQNVDSCPVFGMPQVIAMAPPLCGAMFDALSPNATGCDGLLPQVANQPAHILGVMCETPRPDTAACLPKDPTTESYTVGPMLSFTDARAYCATLGQHLVELSSFAELHVLSDMVSAQALGEFWMAPTFDGTRWHTATGCPAEFSWANSLPTLGGSCLASVNGDGEMRGMDVTSCTATKLAVCESD